MSETAENTTNPNTPYRVLARKYRPQTFEDLIGQDAMVRTLTNAFASGRIAQAYMLTGVRGIGKTTTARLIARALNFQKAGEDTGPSVDLSVKGEHCDAILESRHVDVIEMDAASHTGVDNVREINDAVKYKPASARYKVYIIDEVHMLSTAAFNALLKTLEEPPPHVKFIFATTEIRKVPVTVLSRCQRFDLRRLEAGLLVDHFQRISDLEGVKAETEALGMIARAAEGSVRDGLSLLDQAIAYGTDQVRADDVQSMLGLSDRARIIDLFDAVMRGDAAAAMDELEAQHNLGADPEVIMADLAGFVHWVTKLKVSPKSADDAAVSQAERTRGKEFAGKLAMPVLARSWQMLLKGMEEVSRANNALMAAEMLLIRMAHVADMPAPEELARIVKGADSGSAASSAQAAASSSAAGTETGSSVATSSPTPAQVPGSPPVTHAPVMTAAQLKPAEHDDDGNAAEKPPQPTGFASFDELVAYVSSKRDVKLVRELERHVLPVSVGTGRIELSLLPDAPAGIANELSRRLEAWTGNRWIVSVSTSQTPGQTIADQKRERRDDLFRRARESDDVQAVLKGFPRAEIMEVRDLRAETAAPIDEQHGFDEEATDDLAD
ncbi:DNA polymerase III subunit gamma/tau [Anderseniella sp. Alg231-50]|uniref:DNA polymerase III subunit gamma/tau n=1 Tax=Anderseniella sp. Alg231-50 TaxID=1922226 RepID=UPI000D55BB30